MITIRSAISRLSSGADEKRSRSSRIADSDLSIANAASIC